MVIRVGSLFSGVGGIDLGLQRTGGFRTIWFSEIEPYCCEVLKERFPGVPNVGDITKVDWDGIERPDMLVGGFPCQPVSVAGKRKAQDDERWLWPEFARAIRLLRPELSLLENVPGLLNAKGGDAASEVFGDLAETGNDCEWDCLSAAEVGAMHKRERVFIIAYSHGGGCDGGECDRNGGQILRAEIGQASEACPERSGWLPRIEQNAETDASNPHCNGNGEMPIGFPNPRIQERFEMVIQEKPEGTSKEILPSNSVSQRGERFWKQEVHRFPEFSWCENIRTIADLRGRPDIPEPLIRRSADGLSEGLDETELEFRRERTAALGNSVCPQVAQMIGEWILQEWR